MKSETLVSLLFVFAAAGTSFSQINTIPPPPPKLVSPPISEQLLKTLEGLRPDTQTPRDLREQAYAKLLEGQRYVWAANRLRSRVGRQQQSQLARDAFKRSVELDPALSEGYTALAELAITSQPQDLEEAIRLARLATRVNSNNFGGRRILARLYTFKSRIGSGTFDSAAGKEAVTEWLQVTRLDPRNAEAWALLSDLYEKSGEADASIEALRRWISSAPPVETSFYQGLMAGQSLAPESASMKLGSALLKAGRTREAVETLSPLVADEPGNFAVVELLRDAIASASGEAAAVATESLQQAVFGDPTNIALVNLLANVYAGSGRIDDAAALLRDSSRLLLTTDRSAAGALLVELGDTMGRADRTDDAIAAYEAAFIARGIERSHTAVEEEREFAVLVFEKMIQRLKTAERFSDVRPVIERSRKMLGKDDLFADRQLISLLRETGSRPEALAAVRSVRQKLPNDYGFLRLEATLLTESGKVDDGVALVRKLIAASSAPPAPTTTLSGTGSESISIAVPPSDAFSNYLFISNLYSQANRGKEAAEAANQAYAIARGSERRQIARLTLATAQQNSGDFKGAEATLRDLLKETPGNPIAMNNLGYFLLEREERFEEALDLIQQAVKIDPTNPSYLDSLGWAFFKLGKLPDAEKHLKEAVRFDSSSGTIHEHLGDVYLKQGKTELAKASWSRSVSLFSEVADVARVKKKLSATK
jgi:tetratricopeptide (TPR) repeat protein